MNWSRFFHTAFATDKDFSGKTVTLHPSKYFGEYQELDLMQKVLWILYMCVHFLFFVYSIYWIAFQDTDMRWGAWMVAATMIIVAACVFAFHAHDAFLRGPKSMDRVILQRLCLGSLALGAIFFEILIVRWILHRQIFVFLPEGLTLTAICCVFVFFATDFLLTPFESNTKPTTS